MARATDAVFCWFGLSLVSSILRARGLHPPGHEEISATRIPFSWDY